MFWIHTIYWLHWILDILFAVACLGVVFRPTLLARLYVFSFLAQQLVLNGCVMSWLQNKAEVAAGFKTLPNNFVMAELFHGTVITIYKILFLTVALWQFYYIMKDLYRWKIEKKAASLFGRS